ncbi:phosphatidylglycerophosphatase A family protein [Histidinibacterium aquaticum]|uniref:Phosphatidylglycerophosphatase A n=1 Tax=Histidinibacterium aquaticum TaxID=2613962 RepID=A0A5J5GLJ4_9RHOB|nr:phosphatidylglycerophosphatase A [Histidinibacterium aquaticum]KAA9009169.1 phosphatidylglycerophosphatase A [Histidinibacterium aquaticum]
MSRLVATFFYVGLLRPGPGTWGSLAALPVALVLHWTGGPLLLIAATGAAFAAGLWATPRETANGPEKDPGHIVIDEVAGQWVALLPVSLGAWQVGAEVTALWPGWIAAFALFRLFDIWKPGPVGRADAMGGAWGVMTDDIVAGVFAAIGVVILAALAHLPVIL